MAEFIVTLAETAEPRAVAKGLSEAGCTVKQTLDELHLIVMDCDRLLISELRTRPDVVAIEESTEMRTPE